MICKNKKCRGYHEQQECRLRIGECRLFLQGAVFLPKRIDHADEIQSDIDGIEWLTEYAPDGVEAHRDKAHAADDAVQSRRQEICRKCAGTEGALQDGQEKHRKKQELQMLPRRFIDRGKKTDENIFTRPFIGKMEQCAKYGYENKMEDVLSGGHGLSLLLSSVGYQYMHFFRIYEPDSTLRR